MFVVLVWQNVQKVKLHCADTYTAHCRKLLVEVAKVVAMPYIKNVAQVYASYVTEKEIVKTLFCR